MSCDRAPSFLGAYVLGALAPPERRAADEHLAGCRDCAAELAGFRGLTAQLDRVPAAEVAAEPVTPSPELFGRVAAEVRRPRRRWTAVAAAAAAALAVGSATWVAVHDDAATGIGVGDDAVVRTATSGQVRVTVTAEERDDGTALDVTVAGLERGERCTIVVMGESVEPVTEGSWTVPGGPVSYPMRADVPPDDLSEVVLRGDDGRDLVTVEF